MNKYFLIFLIIFFSNDSVAAQLFEVSATRLSNGQQVSAGFDSVEDALNYFKGKNLNSLFGANVNAEAINVNLNYRGLGANLRYDGANRLILNIDGIVSNAVFTGATRDQAVENLKDFFKSSGSDIINQVNKRLAAVSPTDPVAGNPTSLMWQMADNDFALAFSDSLYDSGKKDRSGKIIGNEMGFGMKYGDVNVAGFGSRLVSVAPFSYRRNINNSNVKFLIQIPVLTTVMTGGATVYQVSSSMGLAIPLYKRFWSITPMISGGVVGSREQGSASAMKGLSLTNKFHAEIGKWGFSLGTMLARYNTEPIKINGYRSNPNISNDVLKNSFALGIPLGYSNNYLTELSVTNTRYYGTALYIENAMEYGIGLVKTNRGNRSNNEVRFDIKYFTYSSRNYATIGDRSKDVRGVMGNLKFQY